MPEMPTIDDLFAAVPARLRALFAPGDLPWEPLDRLAACANRHAWPRSQGKVSDSARIRGAVEIGYGTAVGPLAAIVGAVIIGDECLVQLHAFVRPHLVTGDSCMVGHSVEVTHSVLLDDVRLSHLNYVGDSVPGNGVRFGPGRRSLIFASTRSTESWMASRRGARSSAQCLGMSAVWV